MSRFVIAGRNSSVTEGKPMMLIVAVNERGLRIGDSHHNARYSDREIEHVLEMRDEGKSYGFISTVMDMPKSTVASICQGGRRCQIAAAFKRIVRG